MFDDTILRRDTGQFKYKNSSMLYINKYNMKQEIYK